MKNTLVIDFDSERDQKFQFKKNYNPPETKEEAGEMVRTEVSLLIDALDELIKVADTSDYQDREVSVGLIKEKFNL